MTDEERELEVAHVPGAQHGDVAVALVSLVVVVGASAAMERAASTLGSRLSIPGIVVGGIVLAAVTSLPNAVAAVYLARRGRGAAMLSTALNSNAINIAFGLLLPAAVIGLGTPTGAEIMIASWYAGLTAVVLACAYRDHGLRRGTGIGVLIAYAVFAVTLGVLASEHTMDLRLALGTAGLVAVLAAIALLLPGRACAESPVVAREAGAPDPSSSPARASERRP